MSEHKATSAASGQTTGSVVMADQKRTLRLSKRAWIVVLLVIALLVTGLVAYVLHQHNQNKVASPVEIQQQNITSDTTNSAKLADLLQLGSVYESQHNTPKAVASYKQAEALDKNNFSAPRSLFELYAGQHDKQNAVIYGKKAIAILIAHPDSPYADDLPYYRQWLENVQAGNFQAPQIAKDPHAL